MAVALAVRDGRILAVGETQAVFAHRGPDTEMVDLRGRAILPGFVDAHGHLTSVARMAATANVASPPVGPVEDLDDLVEVMRAAAAGGEAPVGDWLVGAGYDDALLAEGRHPNRDDLDRISPDQPVALFHVSLHFVTLNSKALERIGVGADTPDPEGGLIRRRAGSREPDGVLEERALALLMEALPEPDLEEQLTLLSLAQDAYARNGFTTVQEGALSASEWPSLREAARRGQLSVDVVAYPIFTDMGSIFDGSFPPGIYQQGLKLKGVKLVLDGSPQGKTAWLTEPYLVPPPGRDADYRGYPWLEDAQVEALVTRIAALDLQLIAHANGDAAADQLIAAVEKSRDAGAPLERPVMIHAQYLREDQLDRMAALGLIPSFFSAHTFFWGDWHRDSVLGAERAARISAAASARRRGMHFTVHNDAPVVPPNSMRLLWATVNRQTRSGQVLGADQRIPVEAALRALTLEGAYQNGEEGEKGSIEVGKLADLVIVERSPLAVSPEELAGIRVVETVKAGKSIYRAPDA